MMRMMFEEGEVPNVTKRDKHQNRLKLGTQKSCQFFFYRNILNFVMVRKILVLILGVLRSYHAWLYGNGVKNLLEFWFAIMDKRCNIYSCDIQQIIQSKFLHFFFLPKNMLPQLYLLLIELPLVFVDMENLILFD